MGGLHTIWRPIPSQCVVWVKIMVKMWWDVSVLCQIEPVSKK